MRITQAFLSVLFAYCIDGRYERRLRVIPTVNATTLSAFGSIQINDRWRQEAKQHRFG